jgi:hypothetical protein
VLHTSKVHCALLASSDEHCSGAVLHILADALPRLQLLQGFSLTRRLLEGSPAMEKKVVNLQGRL